MRTAALERAGRRRRVVDAGAAARLPRRLEQTTVAISRRRQRRGLRAAPVTVQIDFDGLPQRIISVPGVPERQYSQLQAGVDGSRLLPRSTGGSGGGGGGRGGGGGNDAAIVIG